VQAGGEELSYGELNARANRIARAIRERRGEDEEPVALLLSQGAGLVAHELPGRDTALFVEPAVGALAESLGTAFGRSDAEAGRAISRRP